jgi:hypothetical protein
MSAYVEQLNRRLEQSRIDRAAAKAAAEAEKAKQRLAPLDVRLARLLGAIGDDEKADGLPIVRLQHHLLGQKRGYASCRELSQALLRARWVRYRYQSRNGPTFVRWFPPGTPLDEIRRRCKAAASAHAAE